VIPARLARSGVAPTPRAQALLRPPRSARKGRRYDGTRRPARWSVEQGPHSWGCDRKGAHEVRGVIPRAWPAPGCRCDSVCAAGCGSSEQPRKVEAYATQRLCAPSRTTVPETEAGAHLRPWAQALLRPPRAGARREREIKSTPRANAKTTPSMEWQERRKNAPSPRTTGEGLTMHFSRCRSGRLQVQVRERIRHARDPFRN